MERKFSEWRDDMESVAKNFPEALEKALTVGVRMVRAEAVEKHLSGPKMPRGVGDLTNATLQPQSGHLRLSLQTKVSTSPGKLIGRVFTNAEYAPTHEFGRGNIPKRPFLVPSLEEKRPGVIKAMKDIIVEALRGG